MTAKLMLGFALLAACYFRYCSAGYCSQTYTHYGTCYTIHSYQTDCGFWNLASCTRYKSVAYSCPRVATRRYCCSGYTGSGCTTPICHGHTSCLNGGTCASPNNCHCRLGYGGPRCEVPQRNVCNSHSGTWTQWSTCSRSCGGGTRTRQCRYDHPVTTIHETCHGSCLNGGTFHLNKCHCKLGTHGTCCEAVKSLDDTNDIFQYQKHHPQFRVLETNVCIRNSNTWTPWSACSVSCGGGTRTRQCVYDHPVTTAHAQCNPTCLNGGTFTNNQCRCIVGTKGSCCEVLETTVCYIHSGTWSPWSSCSTTCGGGTRTRQCKYDHPVSTVTEPCSETCLNEGSYNDGRCQCIVGTHGRCCEVLEDDVCYKHSDTWSPWGVCSKSCGGGTKSRQCKYGHVTTDLEHCARTCYNEGEYYGGQCNCIPGTTGSCCTDIPECASNPCKNGGVCEEHVNYYTCKCPAGTSQPNCDDILECASNPCKNNGTCNEYVNGFECTCMYGTTGPYCDDIPDCISKPCLNGGTCIEHVNGYSCACSPDYTGFNCADTAICSSHPCQNGATCNDFGDRYNCTCPVKYYGTNCELDPLSPHDSTCRHSGSCYIIFRTIKHTWDYAKKVCEARKGHLAVPDDIQEQLFLESYLDSMRVRYHDAVFWIGAIKSGAGPAHWVTGQSPTFTRWPIGVSDNVAGTQCLSLDGNYDFKWQAFSCNRTSYYICEEKVPFTGPDIIG